MIKFSAFRTQKPREFTYMPRYYDPEKERREERRRVLLGDREPLPEGEYTPGKYIRRSVAVRRGTDRSFSKRYNPRRPLMILAAAVILMYAFWWILIKL